MVDHEDVRYVARLARLRLEPHELDRYAEQLSSILKHINKISELDLEGTEPMSHVLDLTNVLREDEVHDSLDSEEALANGPDVEDGAFRVPPIIGE